MKRCNTGVLILLCTLVPMLSGCIFNPFYQIPENRLGRWKTHHFDGSYTCENEGREHTGEDSQAKYIGGDELKDGTVWSAVNVSDVVPRTYTPRDGREPRQYVGACALVLITPPDRAGLPQVWFEASSGSEQSFQINPIDHAKLVELLEKRDFKRLQGEVVLEQDGAGRIRFDIDALLDDEAVRFVIKGDLKTRLHFGRVKTTYNMKGHGFDHYRHWISRTWR